ncbi:hypothetical protein AB0I91_13730 [Actinosynnema sp. NPDC049800]
MSATEFTRRIQQALNIDRPSDSVDSVKSAVIDQLVGLDERIRIKKTEYFNHSFAPDLVVTWPRDPARHERNVYLRVTPNIEYLIDDLAMVGDTHPIILDLDQTYRGEDEALINQLDDRSAAVNALVADPSGIDWLRTHQSSDFLKLVNGALTQGGRGLIDQPVAARTTATLTNGLDGALRTLEGPTRLATQVLERYLDGQQSSRIQGLLQAVWVGSGGRLDQFPGRKQLSEELSPDALQFILEYDAIDDRDFWRRLGRHVSMKSLAQLDLPSGTKNLEHLMGLNMDVLWARSCRVKAEQDRLASGEKNGTYWFIDAGFVALKVDRYAAYLTDKVDELDRIAEDKSDGASIVDVSHRASSLDIRVDEATLSNGHQTVKYYSDTASVLDDENLAAFAEKLGGTPLVQRVEVVVGDGKHLSCDFTTFTSSGRTRTQLRLPELILGSVPLLRPLGANALRELLDKFSDDYSAQPELPLE